MKVRAQAALAEKGRLQPFEYDPGPLGPTQVDVRVTHCGICHTDSATVDNDFGISQYPLVPGHEAVGVIAGLGAAVDRLQIGQRVGVGPMCGSCMACEWCESGLQHLCANVGLTIFGGHHGAFATHVRVNNWQFAFPLPDAIASEHAGPLMCAGATVFTPILQYGVRPTDRVAVVGVGGLGHLAVQYLAKWGCDVTAVSSSRDKEPQARSLGATHFIATGGTDELRKAARSFDFIFCTVSGDLPWDDVRRRPATAGEAVPHRHPCQAHDGGSVGADRRREVDRWGSNRLDRRHRRDAGIHGPARDQASHRDVPDVGRRSCARTHAVRQGAFPSCLGGLTDAGEGSG